MADERPLCFVICPIGEEGSPVRERSDGVFEMVVKPAAEESGYRAERTIDAAKPGWITERIVRCLLEAPMVVADLTGRNPNVFYELAIRHMVRKPFVQIMQSGEEVPFDVFGIETIFYDPSSLTKAADARNKLTRQMRLAEQRPDEIRTPVSIASDLMSLGTSANPVLAVLQDLLETQREIVARLDRLAPRPKAPMPVLGRVAARSHPQHPGGAR